jgi:putative cell wall-binding protein
LKKIGKFLAVTGLVVSLISPNFALAATDNDSEARALPIPAANTWVSDTDNQNVDVFSFTGIPRGKLTFSVKYSESEFNYWKMYGENYISYSILIEKKDGTFTSVGSGGVTYGMPNQTYTQSVTIDQVPDDRTFEAGYYYNNEKDFTGKYLIKVNYTHKYDPNFQVTASFEPIVPPPPHEKSVTRFGGKDRFEVNKQMTGKIVDHSLDYVILAYALNYPDALTSGTLSSSDAATLLVTDNQTVINDNIKEAKRLLKPYGKILIIGGPASVSTNVENAFKSHFPVERIGGKDRIEVSTAVAERFNPNPNQIFLTYGLVFSDALSIVPYATKSGIPIILQYGIGLEQTVQAYIQKHPTIKKVTIVSGTGVIPVSVENQLKSLGVTTVERVAGQNRYDTSLMIAQKYFSYCTSVALANGNVFADALSGNQYAYKNNMPIILVENNNALEETKEFIKNRASENIFLYGGTATINDNIINYFK